MGLNNLEKGNKITSEEEIFQDNLKKYDLLEDTFNYLRKTKNLLSNTKHMRQKVRQLKNDNLITEEDFEYDLLNGNIEKVEGILKNNNFEKLSDDTILVICEQYRDFDNIVKKVVEENE